MNVKSRRVSTALALRFRCNRLLTHSNHHELVEKVQA